jgi:ubiquitin-activating enzyme E1
MKILQGGLEVDEELARAFSWGCQGDLCPMNAFIGGFVGQEVMKAGSGKFTPLDQWLLFDATECAPLPSPTSAKEKDTSRYAGQIRVFGPEFQEALGRTSVFIVGAGAIGECV